jgi:metallo-beta-lactamase family protein
VTAPRVALRFLGGAGTVTGSRFQLEIGERALLIDCGLFQGLKPLRLQNWQPWPFDLGCLDAVVLTHAHIDHSGYLPRLYKLGYRGPIYCTEGTAALLEVLLPDAAHLQEEEAEYANRKGYSKHHPAEPLYRTADAHGALSLVRTAKFDTTVSLLPNAEVTFVPAGHLLGSASLLVRAGAGEQARTVLVSGDLGKYDDAFMGDPRAPAERVDYLLIESTYGDRKHDDTHVERDLGRIVRGAVECGGILLVPAFAIGRTQELLFHLARLERAREIPVLDVYVDSPMAVDATHTYLRHREDLNFDWYDEGHVLKTERTRFVRTTSESKALASVASRAIIISASGMATGGRVLHHLTQRVGDARNTVLFAGYQVDGTRGRKLVEGAETIRIFGRDWPVRARVENFRALSAHGDRDDLLRWAGSLANVPRATWVVHGEPRPAQALCEALRSTLHHDARAASMGERVFL